MAKEQTLQKIEEDVAQGNLGIARDRLRGLVNCYPDDLELRVRLGDLYFKLGYPNEAGCYWFLVQDPSEEQSGPLICLSNRAVALQRQLLSD